MAKVYVPCRRPESWRPLLTSPQIHWRIGRSAYELAHSWQGATGFPASIVRVMDESPFNELHDLELLLALPERAVALPGGLAASRIDVFALARGSDGLVAVGVEGKEREPFDVKVQKWLAADGPGRAKRLEYLARVLQLTADDLAEIEYQLVHRTVATILEARRFSAQRAVVLIHSFSGDRLTSFDAFHRFARLLETDVQPGRIARVGLRDELELYLVWVPDTPRPQNHAGAPEGVLLEALGWLRDAYREHRFFKERDVEATLQQRMSELFEERRSDWRVYESFRIPGKLLDLAVVDRRDLTTVRLAVELKYEPARARGERDLLARKFPVVAWSEVIKDVEDLRRAVADRVTDIGYALLLDEGGYWRDRRREPSFGAWDHWGVVGKDGLDPAVLMTRLSPSSNGTQRSTPGST